ncbi:MAG: response regulator transcription factor [Acidobacteria bacterium]|nr:response regulator transcription factor [Acidobacteriota bacterium]
MAWAAEGAIRIAGGDARGAVAPLRRALDVWRDLDAPYEAARVRLLAGRACRALGDVDGARLEWDAAAAAFRACGAAPALAEARSLAHALDIAPSRPAGALTARETEVLRLVAAGGTNREIAHALDISEKTVARHVSNIFTKLDLSTRASAAAYAFRHGLVS